MRNQLGLCLAALALAAPASASAQEAGKQSAFGGVVAPVALPSGGSAAYGYAGVPELGAGYRQGIGPLEVEGRVRFNYFDVSIAGEVLLKAITLHGESLELAPMIGLGLIADSGATYINSANFSYFGFRVLPGLLVGYRLAETVEALGELDFPMDFTFSHPIANRVSPLLGGGAEFYVGDDISVLAMGQLGPDVLKESLGTPVWRLGYQVKLGLGWRFF